MPPAPAEMILKEDGRQGQDQGFGCLEVYRLAHEIDGVCAGLSYVNLTQAIVIRGEGISIEKMTP